MIDPKEINELDNAIKAYEVASLNLLQASRRILLIAQMNKNVPKVNITNIPGYTGNPCSKCHSMLVIRTGTCMTCQSCGNNEGCS